MIKNTKIVGILNITPDSFSDGNKYTDAKSIIDHTRQLIKDGADVIDVGAESTRPNATKLSDEDEWQRLSPIIEKIINICHKHNVKVSLDTYHAESARKSIELGVDYINDVSGFKNPKMTEAIKNTDTKLIVMHSLTVPADKSINIPENVDVVEEIKNWAISKILQLNDSGIDKSRIIFDPGIGFNKTVSQSKELIERVGEIKELNVPIYIGHSRKSFLGDVEDRNQATIQISNKLIEKNINYIRVHDVRGHYMKIT